MVVVDGVKENTWCPEGSNVLSSSFIFTAWTDEFGLFFYLYACCLYLCRKRSALLINVTGLSKQKIQCEVQDLGQFPSCGWSYSSSHWVHYLVSLYVNSSWLKPYALWTVHLDSLWSANPIPGSYIRCSDFDLVHFALLFSEVLLIIAKSEERQQSETIL